MANLKKMENYNTMNFCSIGCGYRGEEYLLQGEVNKLVLIEPDLDTCLFLQRKFRHEKTEIINQRLENYRTDIIFNIIYTSGPTNWMLMDPWAGVPDAFLKFLENNLDDNGVFIARLYGSLHLKHVISSNYYAKCLLNSARKKELTIVNYTYHNLTALLVIAKSGSSVKSEGLPFLEPGTVLIKNGEYIGKNQKSLVSKITRTIRLLIYIPLRILIDTGKSIKVAFDLLKLNLKLIDSSLP